MFRAILFIGLVSSIGAIRPVVSNNEWTPVTNSQRVYLSPEVLAKYRAQEAAEEAQEAQERYEVVNVENEQFVEDQEDATESIIIIQEEQQFEPQKVSAVQESVDARDKNEETPIIVYPEGTPGQPDYSSDPNPAPVFPSKNPTPNPSLPYPPRRPAPPQFNRRPLRPQPPNLRRPPPPPPRQPPSKYLPALSRNNPPQPQEPRPRPPPPRPNAPRLRPRPPPPQKSGGIIGAIAGVGGILKCKAEDVASDIRLQDEGFVRQQLDCVLDEGPCDDLGATIKRMAPDIMKGLCPPPCDECKKKQIQKVMSTIAKKYPKEWNQMVQRIGK